MIRGIILDVDGTLLDSMRIWGELGKRYLFSVGIEAKPGLAEILFPMSLDESSEYLKETYRLSDSTEKITRNTIEILRDYYNNEVMPKAGVLTFIKQMRDRNIPMVIATSGDRRILDAALERIGVFGCFKAILTCQELKTNKRNPMIYLHAADIMGTAPEETAVFEDVMHAIIAAKQAGFLTYAVEDAASKQNYEEIKRIADYYLKDFLDPVLYESGNFLQMNNS